MTHRAGALPPPYFHVTPLGFTPELKRQFSGARGGDADWYGYCVDDPVNRVDAWGLEGRRLPG
jgi:hypothetical protein